MKGACIIRIISLVGLVAYLFAMSTPFYMQIAKVDEGGETKVVQTSQQFWYLTRFESCTGTCDTSFTSNFWTFGEHSKVRIVFGITWTLTLLATISTLFVTVSGKALGSLVSLFFGFLALLVFLSVTPAIKNNTELCPYGPCDSFTGYVETDTTSNYWGPSIGWYACVLAVVWMFVVGFVGTLCCIRDFMCKRHKHKKNKKNRKNKNKSSKAPLLNEGGGWAKYSENKKNEMKELV